MVVWKVWEQVSSVGRGQDDRMAVVTRLESSLPSRSSEYDNRALKASYLTQNAGDMGKVEEDMAE
jgi:hypothetical protein